MVGAAVSCPAGRRGRHRRDPARAPGDQGPDRRETQRSGGPATGPACGAVGSAGAGRTATQVDARPLPAPATALIGRERERTEVVAAVAASRLVTLTGPGGTGKTRLALQAARDLAGNFADGVAFIDLAPVVMPG